MLIVKVNRKFANILIKVSLISISLYFLLVLPVYKVANRDLKAIDFWEDETLTYFASKGITIDPNDYNTKGDLHAYYNASLHNYLDPGGFAFILRYWSNIFGSSAFSIRFLSMIFLILAIAFIIYVQLKLKVDSIISILNASLLLVYSMFLHYSTELRAYSMEMFCVIFSFFISAIVINKNKKDNLLLIGITLMVLSFSRYSSFVYIGASGLAYLIASNINKQNIINALKLYIPSFLGVLFLWRYYLSIQVPGSGYQDSSTPVHAQSYLIKNYDISKLLIDIKENFFGYQLHEGDYFTPYFAGIFVTTFLILFSLFIYKKPEWLTKYYSIIKYNYFYVIISLVLQFLFSATGKLPWVIHTRWSIGYQALSLCCLISIILILLKYFHYICKYNYKYIYITSIIIAFFTIQYFQKNAFNVYRPYYETVGSNLTVLAESVNAKKIKFYVPFRSYTDVRYLCEFGALKNKFTYPQNFHFETYAEITSSKSISALEYDYVVLRSLSNTHEPYFDTVSAYAKRIVLGNARLEYYKLPSGFLRLKQ